MDVVDHPPDGAGMTGPEAPSRSLVRCRSGTYRDSVTLMRASTTLGGLPGVEAAIVAMGTPLNLELLAQAGFVPPNDVGPADLVVAVRAVDQASLDAAEQALDGTLTVGAPIDGTGAGWPGGGPAAPRSIGVAARRLRDPGGAGVSGVAGGGAAGVALVSVPGQHAFVEAMDALEAGLHPMVFSDNMPVEQEIRLKDEAARRGLLVMGPDCGTAILAGVGLGFANATRPGPVGVVAASGTGAQQVVCLLDAADVGVSHVIGVGGRDLSAAVGARSTLAALAALDADPATELVVVVSKPPDADVARLVRTAAAASTTPVLLAFPGRPTGPAVAPADGSARLGNGLTTVAEDVLRALDREIPMWPHWSTAPQLRRDGALRGLFCGGTLCAEALAIATEALGPVRSNIPLAADLALPSDLRAAGHAMIDFGDDALTAGRPHPMIDPSLRVARLLDDAADPAVGVVLLDVVLGFGAHPDPSAELVPAIRSARATAARTGHDLAVVVTLLGTSSDPQDTGRQALELRDAGAEVFGSNAAAARHAVALVRAGR